MSCYDHVVRGYVDEAIAMNKHNKSCHVAILLSGKKVISVGFNQMDRQCFRGKTVHSVHAEVDCLRKCRPIRDIMKRNYTLVVVKVSKDPNGSYYDSMPCKECTKFLKGLNFRKVYCSNNAGQIVKINLNDYVPYNIHIRTESDTETQECIC
jgi:deoxycytidylate deaminase